MRVVSSAPGGVGALPGSERSAEEARRVADEVLADAVFDRPAPGLLVRARDWFFDRIEDAVQGVLGSPGSGVVGWLIVGALAILAVLLVVRFTRGAQRDPGATTTASGPRRPATDWLAEASGHEAAGDVRAGLRCRHRALVAALATRGIVDEVPGRTAGEYRAEVARRMPAAARDFDGATSLFELAWYGGRDVGAVETGCFSDMADRVLVAAGRP